jgi:hypothetical protein
MHTAPVLASTNPIDAILEESKKKEAERAKEAKEDADERRSKEGPHEDTGVELC